MTLHDTTEETRNTLIAGLRNAHAMEHQALSIMKPQASRLEHYGELEARLRRHIEETEGQIERIESALEAFDERHSGLKDAALSLGGTMASLSHGLAPDEVLKNAFANFAFENYEIAAYSSLIALAELEGASGIMPALQANLAEERDMAAWIEDNLAELTLRYAGLRDAGISAKK